MIAWNKVIENALFLFMNKDNITYNLGCTGEVVGRDKNVENQFRYYCEHGWKDKMIKGLNGANANMTTDQIWKLWSKQHANKMAFDCSGFIDFCLGFPGQHKYYSTDFGNMTANSSLSTGVAGSALWKSGHVGLDIGYGFELEIGDYNDTIVLRRIKDRTFTKSIRIKDVNYTGADAR